MDTYYCIDNYRVLIPPLPLNYDSWTPKQAKENLDWFAKHMDDRADYVLRKSIGMDLPHGTIDAAILIEVWRWFLSEAAIESVSKEEIDAQHSILGYLGENFVAKERLSVRSEYMVRDIAMLVSAVFIHNYPVLYLDVDCKPKRYVFVNQPVIKGFIDNRHGKPFHSKFPSVHMINVQASKILDNTFKPTDIFDVFNHWTQDIPKV